MSNSRLRRTFNDRPSLTIKETLEKNSLVRKNQTTVTLENYFYFSFSSKYRASMVGLGSLEEFRC